MKKYLLDTNIISYLLRQDANIITHITQLDVSQIYVSVITQAELSFGLAKVGNPKHTVDLIDDFISHVNLVDWTSNIVDSYARIKLWGQQRGVVLDAMDMLIAAHAHALNATLVSRDRAFLQFIEFPLRIETWE